MWQPGMPVRARRERHTQSPQAWTAGQRMQHTPCRRRAPAPHWCSTHAGASQPAAKAATQHSYALACAAPVRHSSRCSPQSSRCHACTMLVAPRSCTRRADVETTMSQFVEISCHAYKMQAPRRCCGGKAEGADGSSDAAARRTPQVFARCWWRPSNAASKAGRTAGDAMQLGRQPTARSHTVGCSAAGEALPCTATAVPKGWHACSVEGWQACLEALLHRLDEVGHVAPHAALVAHCRGRQVKIHSGFTTAQRFSKWHARRPNAAGQIANTARKPCQPPASPQRTSAADALSDLERLRVAVVPHLQSNCQTMSKSFKITAWAAVFTLTGGRVAQTVSNLPSPFCPCFCPSTRRPCWPQLLSLSSAPRCPWIMASKDPPCLRLTTQSTFKPAAKQTSAYAHLAALGHGLQGAHAAVLLHPASVDNHVVACRC